MFFFSSRGLQGGLRLEFLGGSRAVSTSNFWGDKPQRNPSFSRNDHSIFNDVP